jgi:hypothetical protein
MVGVADGAVGALEGAGDVLEACAVALLLLLPVCVFITAVPITKLFAWEGGGRWRTCATRDDEPRPVWTSLPITHWDP